MNVSGRLYTDPTDIISDDRDYSIYLEESLADDYDSDEEFIYHPITPEEAEDFDTFIYGAPLTVYQTS